MTDQEKTTFTVSARVNRIVHQVKTLEIEVTLDKLLEWGACIDDETGEVEIDEAYIDDCLADLAYELADDESADDDSWDSDDAEVGEVEEIHWNDFTTDSLEARALAKIEGGDATEEEAPHGWTHV